MVLSAMLALLCAVDEKPLHAASQSFSGLPNSLHALHALHTPKQGESLPSPSPLREEPSSKNRVPSGSTASPKNEIPSSIEGHLPEAALVAHRFLSCLLKKDWEAMFLLAAFPFWLESKTFSSPQTLREAWEKQLSQRRLDGYEIRGIEVLTLEQMKERFGPPPERLGKLLSGRHSHWFAVANLSGRAVVLLLQPPSRHNPAFKVVAFHD
jgi:hypothetical protein